MAAAQRTAAAAPPAAPAPAAAPPPPPPAAAAAAAAPVSDLSLEAYCTLHAALTRSDARRGAPVAPVTVVEEAWYKLGELRHLLQLHGLTASKFNRSELLAGLAGRALLSPFVRGGAQAGEQPQQVAQAAALPFCAGDLAALGWAEPGEDLSQQLEWLPLPSAQAAAAPIQAALAAETAPAATASAAVQLPLPGRSAAPASGAEAGATRSAPPAAVPAVAVPLRGPAQPQPQPPQPQLQQLQHQVGPGACAAPAVAEQPQQSAAEESADETQAEEEGEAPAGVASEDDQPRQPAQPINTAALTALSSLPAHPHSPWLLAQLQRFAASGARVAAAGAEPGPAVASSGSGQLLGRRVGFVLPGDMQVAGPRSTVLTLPAGVYEGIAVKALGGGCVYGELCEADCAGPHAHYRTRLLPPRLPDSASAAAGSGSEAAAAAAAATAATSGRPVLLILDLHERLRVHSFEALMQLTEAQLQDAWLLLEEQQEPADDDGEASSEEEQQAQDRARSHAGAGGRRSRAPRKRPRA